MAAHGAAPQAVTGTASRARQGAAESAPYCQPVWRRAMPCDPRSRHFPVSDGSAWRCPTGDTACPLWRRAMPCDPGDLPHAAIKAYNPRRSFNARTRSRATGNSVRFSSRSRTSTPPPNQASISCTQATLTSVAR